MLILTLRDAEALDNAKHVVSPHDTQDPLHPRETIGFPNRSNMFERGQTVRVSLTVEVSTQEHLARLWAAAKTASGPSRPMQVLLLLRVTEKLTTVVAQ